MMTFSLRFGGGIGRSVAVVLFDISRFGFFGVAHLFLIMPLLLRGRSGEMMRERVLL